MTNMIRMTEEQLAEFNSKRAGERVAEHSVDKRQAKVMLAKVKAWMVTHPNATRDEVNAAVAEIKQNVRGAKL